jgi:hypothetical protein
MALPYTARARAVLPWVDPGRVYKGQPVGLRDGAILAFLAGGLTTREVITLRASAITMQGGRVNIALERDGAFYAVLTPDQGGRVLAWLSESRLWGSPEPVFTGPQGPLTIQGIHHVLNRHRPGRSRR